MTIGEILSRHKVAVLQFSGGKDSLACLWLLEPFWSRITVAWGNAGDAFPETVALMEKVRALVPNFVEVKSNQPEQIRQMGYPTDVLPVRNHPTVMHIVHPHPRPPLQSFYACCRDNLWFPMLAKMDELGATLIIRGQRNAEVQHSPVRSGDVILGVEYLFPVEDWSNDRVHEYVKQTPLGLPAHYAYVNTSLDCMHCTGHLFENFGKRRYMAEHHPRAHAEVSRRLDVIAQEIRNDLQIIEQARATPERTTH